MSEKEIRILAVASGGGHWVQLLRLRPAFEGHRVAFVTVRASYKTDVGDVPFYLVNDATRWDKFGLVRMCLRLLLIILRERPKIIISTGAAPGYFAIRFGKLLGARTIWLDSIANVEEVSMTGRLVRKHADLWLTQWPHLAAGPETGDDAPRCLGAVL
ncbi:MAG: UDP-N-acetylglucosamine--LPS N-acetylglucosamine transferase [Phycisphaerales bacterium JB054]